MFVGVLPLFFTIQNFPFDLPLFTIKENVLFVLYFHVRRGSYHFNFLVVRFYLKQANPKKNKLMMTSTTMMMMMMMTTILQIRMMIYMMKRKLTRGKENQ